MSQRYTREEGVDILMQYVIDRARNGTIADLETLLSEGPPGRRPAALHAKLAEWYQEREQSDKEMVSEIVRQSVDDALFSLFAILDGVAGGRPIRGVPSDFAIYLQTYEDESKELDNVVASRVRLNPPNATTDLHDIFRWQVEDLSADEND